MSNNNDIIHKEIDLIQSIIKRMANNSFLLKGWLISLIAVILALSDNSLLSKNNYAVFLILLIPTISFWFLDAFFLHKEKCYRKLYDWVIEQRPKNMDSLYNLDYTRFKKDVKSVVRIMFSTTLLAFYGTPFISLLAIILNKLLCNG